MAPPGSLVSGWDVHHLPGKPPAGFEDFPEPSFVSSTSSLRRNSLGTPSSPKLSGPPALGTVSQPHWTGSSLGHHAGKHGDVDHHRRIQLAEHAETALNIGVNALTHLLPGHAAGAIPDGSVSAAQLQTGSFRDHHQHHYPVSSTGGRSLSDDGASQAHGHHASGLGWWSRLDSGRLNDSQIAEMEAEAVEEGPLSRRSRDYMHVPYLPTGVYEPTGAVPLFRVMPVDTASGGHATTDEAQAGRTHVGVQSAVGSAAGAAATPMELLQETHSGIGSGKDGAQAAVNAVGPAAAAPAHLIQTHAGVGSGKEGAQQVADAAGALAAAPPELVQAHAGIGSGKDGAQQVAAVAEAQRVTLPSFTTSGSKAKAAVAKDLLLDVHEGIGSGKEGAAHVMEVVESEMRGQ